MAVDPVLLPVLRDFAGEAAELCQALTLTLLEAEREGTSLGSRATAYESASRKLHTLKGSAATLGLAALSDLVHRMETVLSPFKANGGRLHKDTADALLASLDAFLAGVKAEAEGNAFDTESARRLLSHAEAGAHLEDPGPKSIPESGEAPESVAVDEIGTSFRVEARQVEDLTRAVESMREVRLRIEERRRHLEALLDTLRRSAHAGDGGTRAALSVVSRGLRDDGEEASEAVASLEEGLSDICTLPVRMVTEPLHRAVRDLCSQTGKLARLSVVGAELSIDRRVLTSLKGPLVHLLRNAVAHGIELPQEREARGKHREGAIVIRIERAGNVLSTEVSDDGNGLDIEQIKLAAERRGMFSRETLDAMRPAELQELIFMQGVSTIDGVTEAAGRGVGLDAVRSQVRALDGQLDVHSTPRQGTRFTLTLPLELGSTALLVVRVGEQQFGIPMLAVESGRAYRPDEALRSRRGWELKLGDDLLPLRDLGQCLGFREASTPARGEPVLLCRFGDRRGAFVVDQVVESRDLAVHPLPREIRDVGAYQGAATLAMGDLLLVLDPAWLIAQGEASSKEPRAAGPHALIVDDSLTARAIYRSILESAGYAVHAAATERQALEQVRGSTYDVILVDILLGETNGIDLVQKLRSRAETRSVPIIVISTESGDAERHRVLSAGANLFLTKAECGSGRLLDEVSWLTSRKKERAS